MHQSQQTIEHEARDTGAPQGRRPLWCSAAGQGLPGVDELPRWSAQVGRPAREFFFLFLARIDRIWQQVLDRDRPGQSDRARGKKKCSAWTPSRITHARDVNHVTIGRHARGRRTSRGRRGTARASRSQRDCGCFP
jgi:hypothetical protein